MISANESDEIKKLLDAVSVSTDRCIRTNADNCSCQNWNEGGPSHSRQVKRKLAPVLVCSFPGSAWERFPRWLCHLRTEQAAEPPRKRSQAEPGNEHRREFALA